ncbi:MAG: IS1634 family transposase, partial [Thermoplasmata archaeon]
MSWGFEFRQFGGRRYLILCEKKRTPKGPRNVRTIYIGTAESLLEKLANPGTPLKSYPYGAVSALLHAAERTGLFAALARHLPDDARRLSVPRLLFLQIAGRLQHPLSREGMAQWFSESTLPFLWDVRDLPSARTLRRHLQDLFGEENPDGPLLTYARVRAIEAQVFRTLLAQGISPRWLLYDETNFFTYHQADRWFRRGHSKEKRYDRNLIGLGLVTAGNLPVLTEVAPGNEGEVKTFARIFDAFLERLTELEVAAKRLTIVFDRGINSKENFDRVLGAMHVIAALDRPEARPLLRIPLTDFHEVTRDSDDEPVLGVAAKWSGFRRSWRVLVTYRERTARFQARTWSERQRKVAQLVARGERHPRRTEKAVWRELTKAIPEGFQSPFELAVEKRGGGYIPVAAIDPAAEQRLVESFGKTAIITDLAPAALSDAELVEGFVSRSEIEEDWKWLKDRHVLSVKPVWVWSEVSVPGHVFLCVMGLLLVRYLQ